MMPEATNTPGMSPGLLAELLGKLLSGLEVPLSLGLLGAARKPLVELRQRLNLGFGWHDEAEATDAVARWLNEQLHTTDHKMPASKAERHAVATGHYRFRPFYVPGVTKDSDPVEMVCLDCVAEGNHEG
jgi:hypothetical protein